MARPGPKTFYVPKAYPSESILLTPLGKRILLAAAERCAVSKSEIEETLLRLYGGRLTRELFEPMEDTDAA